MKTMTVREIIDTHDRPVLDVEVYLKYLRLTSDLENEIKNRLGKEAYEDIKPKFMELFFYVNNNLVNLGTYYHGGEIV